MTALISPLKRKLHSRAPTDLIHFTPYPGRFVASARRNGYRINAAVVRKGVVDPNYNCQDDGWDAAGEPPGLGKDRSRSYQAVAQGAPLWQKDLKFAYILFSHYHSSQWLFAAEDTALIWEIPKGIQSLLSVSTIAKEYQAAEFLPNSRLSNRRSPSLLVPTFCNRGSRCLCKV